eukprot:scaffold168163_cov32-Tisochrysis_lutea.AAC.1
MPLLLFLQFELCGGKKLSQHKILCRLLGAHRGWTHGVAGGRGRRRAERVAERMENGRTDGRTGGGRQAGRGERAREARGRARPISDRTQPAAPPVFSLSGCRDANR